MLITDLEKALNFCQQCTLALVTKNFYQTDTYIPRLCTQLTQDALLQEFKRTPASSDPYSEYVRIIRDGACELKIFSRPLLSTRVLSCR